MQGSNKGFLLRGSVGSVVAACFVVGAIGWAAPQAAGPQAAGAQAAARSQTAARSQAAAPLAAIDQYCVTCHNQRTQTGGFSLDGLDESTIPAHADLWERVLRKLRTGAMPPQGVRRPDRATYDRQITSIESALDKDAPMPGRPPIFHRLNRAEYGNAVRAHYDLAAALLDAGANPNLTQKNLSTAIMIAAGLGTDRATEEFSLDKGTEEGAIEAIKIIRFLVAAGADISVRNKLGKTPLDVAMDRKDRNGGLRYPNAVAALRELSADGGAAGQAR